MGTVWRRTRNVTVRTAMAVDAPEVGTNGRMSGDSLAVVVITRWAECTQQRWFPRCCQHEKSSMLPRGGPE
jgi:hypothetical protein